MVTECLEVYVNNLPVSTAPPVLPTQGEQQCHSPTCPRLGVSFGFLVSLPVTALSSPSFSNYSMNPKSCGWTRRSPGRAQTKAEWDRQTDCRVGAKWPWGSWRLWRRGPAKAKGTVKPEDTTCTQERQISKRNSMLLHSRHLGSQTRTVSPGCLPMPGPRLKIAKYFKSWTMISGKIYVRILKNLFPMMKNSLKRINIKVKETWTNHPCFNYVSLDQYL